MGNAWLDIFDAVSRCEDGMIWLMIWTALVLPSVPIYIDLLKGWIFMTLLLRANIVSYPFIRYRSVDVCVDIYIWKQNLNIYM